MTDKRQPTFPDTDPMQKIAGERRGSRMSKPTKFRHTALGSYEVPAPIEELKEILRRYRSGDIYVYVYETVEPVLKALIELDERLNRIEERLP